MKSAIKIIREQINHFYLVRRLSLYELKSKNKNNYLGMTWEILNPTIQILIYWFVFGTLLGREPIEVDGKGIPFVYWLMAGFFMWIFFYQSTIQGSKSIFLRLKMLSKMNFPISIIPTYVIFSQFYIHLLLLFITISIYQFAGYFISIYSIQLIYFMFAAFCLFISIALITSTLSTIVRDVHMLLNSILRMMLYLSGVLWPISMLKDYPSIVMTLMKMNPLFYIIEGYRAAFFTNDWYFIENWQYTLYFWGLVLLLFLFGSMLHIKFRRHFIDFL
ncbi:teichoic acid transport system permease protein [Salinibacillus kushneri]|uniref:Transport permease protein n=1 Tax=Salinibacillus kushneri TaxID=237682 RepID=A0A1I0JII1_9BACI|nr:ABC transporter permease [Salinibacillus kushneri]SEU09346.1 teichoic acid transport system permease protein [Salinibacillus kushneri]